MFWHTRAGGCVCVWGARWHKEGQLQPHEKRVNKKGQALQASIASGSGRSHDRCISPLHVPKCLMHSM